MERQRVEPSRNQTVLMVILYVLATLGLATLRRYTTFSSEFAFYVSFFSVTVLFLWATDTLEF
jgi:hypothetical protein